ncbi:glycosyltransferase [Maridesulfovibrio sp.]|uniref:glycosyltransferase n=1 Tax=Maridesulfovibrio sp. TaxID=2795000 RepID=UPI002A18B4C0|nr:glycosyltransferase [Maridesulfovibrio sp.]
MLKGLIVQHTALAKSGGAARIAQLIHEGLRDRDIPALYSFEASENPEDPLLGPAEAASRIPEHSIVHLHSSADPAEFIKALPQSCRIIITLHDTKMITGGCINPLDCPRFDQQCRNPCPRNYPDSENVRRRNIAAITESGAELVSPSKWLASIVRKAHAGLKARIIPNGIPWPEQPGNKKAARESIGLHPASKSVLFVAHGGKEAVYKSGPQWETFWTMIKKNVPDAIAFAVGGKTNSREGDFISIPYVDRTVLNRLMLAADVLAYPTLADNHPLVVLEAMANGLPAVSYEVGGVPEQITTGSNGILVPPGNKELFAGTVCELLLNRHLATGLGMNGFYSGKKRFSSERMLNDYVKLYEKQT